jgi:NAD(P)-dependent dehydrogenase (short-subunit alcohol dehydrogenase family)
MAERITSRFGPFTTASEVLADHDLHGRRAIVTGAASGIGVETARALASAGAEVVIAVRNLDAGRKVAEAINAAIGQDRAIASRLDLADLTSVMAFVDAWRGRPLHILINNAAVMACPHSYTADDFEMQIGTNHFGHACLTLGLVPELERAAQDGRAARVVQLSSACHQDSDIHWDDPHYRQRPYDKWEAYGQAKTANVLFAVGFDARYAAHGINANAVMPGGISTGLQRYFDQADTMGWIDKTRERGPASKTAAQGASTSIWAAVGRELEGVGGLYLEDCAEAPPMDEHSSYTEVAPYALDRGSADRLWTITQATLEDTVGAGIG